MYREKKRERRLRDRYRMINKAKRYLKEEAGRYFILNSKIYSKEWIELRARFTYNDLCGCSCDICCNPRRSNFTKGNEKLTIQERREFESYKDMMIDLYGKPHFQY